VGHDGPLCENVRATHPPLPPVGCGVLPACGVLRPAPSPSRAVVRRRTSHRRRGAGHRRRGVPPLRRPVPRTSRTSRWRCRAGAGTPHRQHATTHGWLVVVAGVWPAHFHKGVHHVPRFAGPTFVQVRRHLSQVPSGHHDPNCSARNRIQSSRRIRVSSCRRPGPNCRRHQKSDSGPSGQGITVKTSTLHHAGQAIPIRKDLAGQIRTRHEPQTHTHSG